MNDLRFAFRQLLKNPGFTAVAVLTLALGIGANTAIFTVANALLFRNPAGVKDPGGLVDIGRTRDGHGFNTSSYPNYFEIREQATTLEGVYAYSLFPQSMSLGLDEGKRSTERLAVTIATPNYFAVLGAVPSVGQLFDAGDRSGSGGDPVVVLSHRCWIQRLGGDPGIIGRTLLINSRPLIVVGVAGKGFQGTGVRSCDAWLPMTTAALGAQGAGMLTNRSAGWLLLGARMKAGVSTSQAAAEVEAIGTMLAKDFPEQNRNTGLTLQPMSSMPGNTQAVTVFLSLLTTLVSLVLAVACLNLVGVLLARSLVRRREIAVRLAVGAGRFRLIRQFLTETLLLFALGGLGGLLAARMMTIGLTAFIPALPFQVDVPLTLDGRVLAFTSGLVLAAGLLSGLAPALQGSKTDVVTGLKDGTQSPQRLRLRHTLLVVQVALSVLLVTIAGLFLRALQHAGAANPGFEPHGVELASLDLEAAGYSDATAPLLAHDLLERVRKLPSVQQATIAAVIPGGFEGIGLGGLGAPDSATLAGHALSADWNIVEPGYFSTLRLPLLAGRDFSDDDRRGTQRVAIIGEGAAKRLWPGESAVGRIVVQQRASTSTPLLVIGVARDPKFGSLVDNTTGCYVYLPLQQEYLARWTMLVARMTSGHHLSDEVRGLVAAAVPGLPVPSTQPADDYTAIGLLPQRLIASISGGLGLVGLLLAVIGIYGVTAYVVVCRTREIGVRIALGALPAGVVWMVLRNGFLMLGLGCVLGLALASGLGHLLRGFLFGISPLDVFAFAGAPTLFAVVGLLACWLPARRASRVDPMVALRNE